MKSRWDENESQLILYAENAEEKKIIRRLYEWDILSVYPAGDDGIALGEHTSDFLDE